MARASDKSERVALGLQEDFVIKKILKKPPFAIAFHL